jgi:RNA polymerase sigma-70 factor (ECF subfamily)
MPVQEADAVAGLVRRCREGDAAAAEELFSRYAGQLIRLAERRLGRQVTPREDGEDVVQSVFRTFFRRNAAGELRIESSSQVWRLLVTITLRKVGQKRRRHHADRRDVGAEVPAGSVPAFLDLAASGPGPEDVVALADELEALMRGMLPQYHEVLRLRLEGHGATEIAARLGVSRRTVHRALEWVKDRLGQRLAVGGP